MTFTTVFFTQTSVQYFQTKDDPCRRAGEVILGLLGWLADIYNGCKGGDPIKTLRMGSKDC